MRAQCWDTPECNVGLCADVHHSYRRFLIREPDKLTEQSFIFSMDFLIELACGQLIKTNHNRLSNVLYGEITLWSGKLKIPPLLL